MYDRPFQQTDHPWQTPYPTGPDRHRHGGGLIRTVVFWTAVAVVALMALGMATWAFGWVVHLVALVVRIAVITAVAAFVWRRITRRHSRRFDL